MIRIFDIIISVLILSICSPIIFFIILLIFITDGMPVIFKQQRIGYLGKTFIIFKFRTMRKEIFEDENLRLTKLGILLRKTSLDELPQLLNVLKKDMSIVGPRPLPHVIEKNIDYSIKIKRRKVLPGITGLSQINYTGQNRKLYEKLEYDLQLIDNYNLYNYFKIILKTPFVIVIRFLKNKTSIIK